MTTTTAIRGGAWLTEDIDAASVLTPERLSDEHRLIGRTAEEFIDNEVLPLAHCAGSLRRARTPRPLRPA